MGASQRKNRSIINSIAKTEQSYSCYVNSDNQTKLLLRKAFIEACSKGEYDEVENLLQLGVPVDSYFVVSDSLQYSVTNDRIYALLALLPESNREMSILRTKKLKILDILFQYDVKINQTDQHGKTVLHRLCTVACPEDFILFKKLVEHGADINIKDNTNNSLLHCCCYNEKLFKKKLILKFLLDNGLDPNCRNDDGDTPIHLSAKCGNDAHIKLLLEHNALINMQNEEGDTAIHMSARNLNDSSIHLLVEHNALINIQNYTGGHTPLHQAVLYKKPMLTIASVDASLCCSTIKTLLKCGASANIRDNEGITPLGRSLENNLLRSSGGSELIDEFLFHGADINATDSYSNTIMHICYKKHFVNPNVNRFDCWQQSHLDIKKYVQFGANVNVKNINNCYPIDCCIHFFNVRSTLSELCFLLQAIKYHIEGGLKVNCLNTLSLQKLGEIELYDTRSYEELTKSKTEMFSLLKYCGYISCVSDAVNEIITLKWMCANLIRTSLCPNAIVSIERLSLPDGLQNYILLR